MITDQTSKNLQNSETLETEIEQLKEENKELLLKNLKLTKEIEKL